MSKLRLSFACWNYDRTQALLDGRVQPEGIDLVGFNLPVEETFFRMLRYREFDVAEMSLSSYAMSLLRPEPPFIAIPVFPSRAFRHSCIYVNAASGIREPKDLVGKTVGCPEYQLTAPVWMRGILQDEYGVPVDGVRYRTGGEEEPGRAEKLKLEPPPGVRIEPIGPRDTLSGLLASGGIDALYSPRMPSSFRAGDGRVRRLFEDYVTVEKAWFRKTRLFPIMHTVAIRRSLYEAHPWVAMSLYKAFCAAQKMTYDDLYVTASYAAMLPWLTAHVEETRRELGEDYWPYGLAANREVLDTFLRYHHEQGLSPRRLAPEALFAPGTLESFRV